MNQLLAIFTGTLAGGLLVHLAHRGSGRSGERSIPPGATQPATDLHTPSSASEPDGSPTLIQFLYDKRLTLFNTRREHEWTIYFGGVVLLGAVDAALMTGPLTLGGWVRYVWVAACALVFVIVCGYEVQLQIRNDNDRRAMNELYNRICDAAGIPQGSPVREDYTRRADQNLWNKFGWAFPWQMILLLLVVTGSAALPFLIKP